MKLISMEELLSQSALWDGAATPHVSPFRSVSELLLLLGVTDFQETSRRMRAHHRGRTRRSPAFWHGALARAVGYGPRRDGGGFGDHPL